MSRVVVVGGGISGLAIAHALRSEPSAPEIVLLERSTRLGGNIRSEHAAGYVCEWGPNGFLDNAPATLRLVDALGLRPALQPAGTEARTRFVFRQGRLHPLPTGPWSFLRSGLLSWPGKARLACEPFARRRPDGDETIHAFASRRVGPEAADVLVDAMVSGVFGGDARALSLRACFPKMWEMESRHGGLVRAALARRREHPRRHGEAMGAPLGRLTSLEGGLETLVQALSDRLGPVVRTGVDVRSIQRMGRHYRVEVGGGEALTADVVVLSGGAAGASGIVRDLDAPLADTLVTLPTASMVVVALGFPSSDVPPLDGFGFLVPRGTGPRSLGVLWDSSVYPGRAPQGHVLLRVMLGGATDPGAIALTDDELRALVARELRATMGLAASPTFVRVIRHVRGIPQYTVGHLERLAQIDARLAGLPGVLLAGSAYRGVSINACIAEADDVAADALAVCAKAA